LTQTNICPARTRRSWRDCHRRRQREKICAYRTCFGRTRGGPKVQGLWFGDCASGHRFYVWDG